MHSFLLIIKKVIELAVRVDDVVENPIIELVAIIQAAAWIAKHGLVDRFHVLQFLAAPATCLVEFMGRIKLDWIARVAWQVLEHEWMRANACQLVVLHHDFTPFFDISSEHQDSDLLGLRLARVS
jgi:hypothetical protein